MRYALASTNYQLSQFLIDRNGVISASYLPLEIWFDRENKTLQPILRNGTQWIDVCSKKDEACFRESRPWKY